MRLNDAKSGMQQSGKLFDRLLDETIDLMEASRTLHARIEGIYISAMGFDRANMMTERVMRELLS